MPTQDAEFIKRLRETFKVEAEEHLQVISSGLLELEKSAATASVAAVVENVYREAHSLKGAARAVDLREVETISHAMESAFFAWKREGKNASPAEFDTLHRGLNAIRALLDGLERDGALDGDKEQQDELVGRLECLRFSAPAEKLPGIPQARTTSHGAEVDPSPVTPGAPPPIAALVDAPRPVAQPDIALSASEQPSSPAAVETVRISVARLDSRLLQAEDMLSVKAMAAQHAADLRSLTGQFGEWRKEWARISAEVRSAQQSSETRRAEKSGIVPILSAPVAAFLDWNCDFLRSLENKFHALVTSAEQDRHGIAKRVDDLLEDSKQLLMLPFSTLSALFQKMVRDLARDQEKDVNLCIKGGDIEIDKRILEQIKDAIIHALRNSIDHGVEKPQERERCNKPAKASVTIAVAPVNGNKVEIVISDDGAGVNLEQVKASAVRHGIVSVAEAQVLGEEEALALIFHSQVSTSAQVTPISGRGLGMPIVRSRAEHLGGKVSIQSRQHVGTTLRITLPLTLATFRGVLVRVAGRLFIAPMNNVERVLRVKPRDIQTVENRQAFSLEGRATALVRMTDVLQLPHPAAVSSADPAAPLSVLLLNSSEQCIGFIVDEVLREEEVLVKPLRKPLVRVRNISGATLLGTEGPVPILNVRDLVRAACRHEPAAPAARSAPANRRNAAPAKRVLVVEDSITSRMLLKGILEAAGHAVKTAVDGMDAFATLREEKFDVVISDVEMPRMNGFELTARIRSDRRLADLPVVLVTSLESREQRERGVDAGANAYIVKSSFDQSNLLEAIGRLT